MLAWLVLGLVLVVVAGAVVMDRRRSAQGEERYKLLEGRIQPERGHVELTEEQRRDLVVTWGGLQCPSCGNVHGGMCPRIRQARYHPNGTFERVLFWPDGSWELPEGTITPWDVFGITVAPPPAKEEEKK